MTLLELYRKVCKRALKNTDGFPVGLCYYLLKYIDNEEFGKNFKTGVYLCLLSAVSIVTLSVFTIISIVNWFRS